MKRTAVKKISAVVMIIFLLVASSFNSFAATWQDRLEQQLGDLSDEYESADPEEQEQMQNQFDDLLGNFGLDEMDLGSLSETDIGQIITGIGDNLALDSFMGLASDAFSSGIAMIGDVVGGGLGTSDGSNTATTTPTITSPNNIIANPSPESSTVAVGVPEQNMPVTNAPTTYNTEPTTAGNLVGAGVTTTVPNTTAPQVVTDDMSSSSMGVLVALSVSTVAVLIAIVIFFVLKKK